MRLRLPLALAAALVLPLPALAQDAALPYTAEERTRAGEALQSTLYELLALRQYVHQMHWNVVDEEFYQLHEFYEELYQSLDQPIDRLGARLRALGLAVDARPSAVASNAGLTAPPEGLMPGTETSEVLLESYGTLSRRLEERAARLDTDVMSQDLLIGIGRDVQMDAWMLRAHGR